jgi:hypothetical protein
VANEGRATLSFSINKGNLVENKSLTALFDVTSGKGPSPGAVTVTTTGVNVSFENLTDPGPCILFNLDSTNYVSYGTYDGVTFSPIGEIPPGQFAYIPRLASTLDAGTGTSGPNLRLVANTASCNVQVFAYDR